MPAEFHLSSTPLEPGVTSLEASAGTGKTYTITGLVVRLVAEHDLPIDQVLIVTFTEAATDELRGRVRSGLTEARDQLADPEALSRSETWLRRYASDDDETRGRYRARLDRALIDFDRAVISTIHGFCHRVLGIDPILTEAPITFDLVGDQTELVHRAFEACWRGLVHEADPTLLAWFEVRDARTRLGEDIGEWLRFPELDLHPHPRPIDEIRAERESVWKEVLDEASRSAADLLPRVEWKVGGRRALGLVTSTDRETSLLQDLLAALSPPEPGAADRSLILQVLVQLHDKEGVGKKSAEMLSGELLMQRFDRLVALLDEELHALLPSIRAAVRERLHEEKERRGALSFHDLITKVATATRRDAQGNRSALALELGRRFSAALIDEFQDTDALQWSIFREVFCDPRHHLYLIGDPKQAIYGFRGADLATYGDALKTCDRRYTLTHNYRSSPGMVAAAQAVFLGRENAFIVPLEIPEVKAARTGLGECIGPRHEAPLHFVVAATGEDFAEQTAALVERHLREASLPVPDSGSDSETTSATRPLVPEDCAVLVRTNALATKVRDALESRGIPTRTRKLGTILESPYAHEVLALARAMQSPNDLRRIRRLWASPLTGSPPDPTRHPEPDDRELDQLARAIATARNLWRHQGFVAACESALDALDARAHLARLPDAERVLTDVDHLIEWFGEGPGSRLCDAERLARRLAEELDLETGKPTEIPPRLSSERGVQVMTIHASKGLEFEVVFLPDLGAPAQNRVPDRKELKRARIGGQNVLTRTKLSGDTAQASVETVNAEESLRLAYVALTRAVRRTVVLLRIQTNVPERPLSAAQHLFMECAPDWEAHYRPSKVAIPNKASPEDAVGRLLAASEHWSAETIEDVATLDDESSSPTETRARVPISEAAGKLRVRRSSRGAHLPWPWRRTSFTSITSDDSAGGADVLPAFAEAFEQGVGWEADESLEDFVGGTIADASPTGDTASEPVGLHAFAAGTGPGQLLHDLLESMTFDDPRGERNRALVERLLEARTHRGLPLSDPKAHRAPLDPVDACLDLCERVAGIRWPGVDGPREAQGFDADLAAEWRFALHTDGDVERALAAALDDGRPDSVWSRTARRLDRLPSIPLRGFLTGSIDRLLSVDGRVLVVDWKSNLCGDDASAYEPSVLEEAMVAHVYPLQAALYELATFRFLRSRTSESEAIEALGGSCYVFLRGLAAADDGHADHERGLWFAPPDPDRIRRLDRVLGPDSASRTGGGRR